MAIISKAPMPHLRPLIRHTLILALLCLGTATAPAQTPEDEEDIQIKYRTFGWGLEQSLSTTPTSQETLDVMNAHFSEQQRYTGPRMIRFYSSDDAGIDEWDSGIPTPKIGPDASTQKSATPPPPLAEVVIPHGMKEVLLIFISAPPGSKLPLRVTAMDDSLTQTDDRNVHFYNLSPIEVFVKTFNEVKKVEPRQQARWDLKADDKKSFIAIAVTAPAAKVVYGTRYQIRDEQRIVFFARKQGGTNPDGTPKLQVTSLIDKIGRKQAVPPTDGGAAEEAVKGAIYKAR